MLLDIFKTTMFFTWAIFIVYLNLHHKQIYILHDLRYEFFQHYLFLIIWAKSYIAKHAMKPRGKILHHTTLSNTRDDESDCKETECRK